MGLDHAARARALIGTRFRPQGRDAESGLDCVGLVLCAFAMPAVAVRRDYRMRGEHQRELVEGLSASFRRVALSAARSGDVLLLRLAADQLHLAIVTPAGFVHADAGRGKVVEMAGAPAWPVIAVFRKRKRR